MNLGSKFSWCIMGFNVGEIDNGEDDSDEEGDDSSTGVEIVVVVLVVWPGEVTTNSTGCIGDGVLSVLSAGIVVTDGVA